MTRSLFVTMQSLPRRSLAPELARRYGFPLRRALWTAAACHRFPSVVPDLRRIRARFPFRHRPAAILTIPSKQVETTFCSAAFQAASP
jgi:hypothetical protein